VRKILFLLGQLSDLDVEWLTAKGIKQRVPTGTVLINEGVAVSALYIVLDGALVVSFRSLDQQHQVRLGCGEVVGEMSLIDARPPSATVTVAQDAVVLAIPRTELSRKLDSDAAFAARFYRAIAMFLSHRLRATTQRLGYGKGQPLQEDAEYEDELDPSALDSVHLAGARFDRVLQRLLTG
jgi:CRP/FNR family transcriptional regulator, cyclic AMP receptor protein